MIEKTELKENIKNKIWPLPAFKLSKTHKTTLADISFLSVKKQYIIHFWIRKNYV
jgi:hypothetical protein